MPLIFRKVIFVAHRSKDAKRALRTGTARQRQASMQFHKEKQQPMLILGSFMQHLVLICRTITKPADGGKGCEKDHRDVVGCLL